MASDGPATCHHHVRDLDDPRVARTRRHPLINSAFIAACAVLSGANSFAAIHEFAIDRRTWLARPLDLSNGIPCEDTFRRVLGRRAPAAFVKALLSWMQAVQELTANRLIAVDGQTLRGTYDRRDGKAAIHRVSAWATENKPSLAQVVADEKSNGIAAIPESLALLELSGAVVTIDAMGCQREIAATIRRRGGDYVLAVELNQPTLYERVLALRPSMRAWSRTRHGSPSIRPRRAGMAVGRRGRMRSSRPRRRSIRRVSGRTSARWG